jgi:hypothetical protein
MAPQVRGHFLVSLMRETILGLCAALVLASPACAQFGGSIGGGDTGAARMPSMRDSDPHRHYWIPEGALGPSQRTNACRTIMQRKRSADGTASTRRVRRCD